MNPPPGDAIAILRAFGDCLARGDADGAAALFTPDAIYEEPPAHTFTGRDALRAFIADFAARHTAVSLTIQRALPSTTGNLLAAEWRWAYTRTIDGTRRIFDGISFIELHDGLITHWRGYSARLE